MGRFLGVSRGTSCLFGAQLGSLEALCVAWGGWWVFLGALRASWALVVVPSGHLVSLGTHLGQTPAESYLAREWGKVAFNPDAICYTSVSQGGKCDVFMWG